MNYQIRARYLYEKSLGQFEWTPPNAWTRPVLTSTKYWVSAGQRYSFLIKFFFATMVKFLGTSHLKKNTTSTKTDCNERRITSLTKSLSEILEILKTVHIFVYIQYICIPGGSEKTNLTSLELEKSGVQPFSIFRVLLNFHRPNFHSILRIKDVGTWNSLITKMCGVFFLLNDYLVGESVGNL